MQCDAMWGGCEHRPGLCIRTLELGQSPTQSWVPQGTVVGILRPYQLHIEGLLL